MSMQEKLGGDSTSLPPTQEISNLMKRNEELIGRFMFVVDHNKTLTCHFADLAVAGGRGRTNYMLLAISSIVGRKYIVAAKVQAEAIDVVNILFHVSRTQLISTIDPEVASSSTPKLPASIPKSTRLALPESMATPSDNNKISETTPTKEIIQAIDSDLEGEVGFTTKRKKRKAQKSITTPPNKVQPTIKER
ncbi:uncharacterized protein LOC124699030 [Lolium rigidum]|uniref:uncharacterized protein LOC124699030 n=1 Tax=Lolium rigidum TaxID=89674 RepID=UPI001F5DB86F|nr:uncharacterized protein LOC124699030 [Lolium rigidum]